MKRRISRLAVGFAGILLMVVVTVAAYSEIQWDRRFDAPYPTITASKDPAVIERGRYLAYGPAHCAACHTPPEAHEALDRGEEVAMIGGVEWKLPFGIIRSANLTPDNETGLGRYTDAEVARFIRHSVKPNGRSAVPFMEFQNLSDEDLTAIISYLRSTAPVRNEIAPTELNFIGKAVMATLIRPIGPNGDPPVAAPAEEATVERGAYLVNNVAGCAGCHTQRDMLDGSYTGPRLAGGSPMPLDSDPTLALVPPNLTADPTTGHIYDWTTEQFVARFRAGRLQEGSHMPWPQFARMSDADLKAIHLYLRSLPAVVNDPGPVLQAVGEAR
jgi:mono/diheme cytochrome c family protein